MKNTKNKKGFTLIELMVSIAIIGILTAIITTNFTSSKAKSRDAKRVSDLAQIQLALSLYFDKFNSYPEVGPNGNSNAGGVTSGGTAPHNVAFTNYIAVIPRDPNGTVYPYVVNVSKTDYIIKATLETNSTALSDDLDDGNKPTDSWASSITCGATPEVTPNFYYCVSPR